MSDTPTSPLLNSRERSSSKQSKHSDQTDVSQENTPLLSRSDDTPRYDGSSDQEDDRDRLPSPAANSLRSIQNGRRASSPSAKGGRRWPTIVAVTLLGVVVVTIILGVFFAPAAVEEYAKEALVIEPTNLSIAGFTATGVKARVQAKFRMDAARVKNAHVRNIGRFGTRLARQVESQESKVEVYLPEYGNVLVGTAVVPKVVVDIRNGYTTAIDFETDLEPGDVEGIRQVANDWLEGRLDQIRITGKVDIGLKSGFLPLGIQTISESLVFEGNDLPAIPAFNITRIDFREAPVPISGHRGMAADVSLSVINSYPIKFEIPPLGFDILVQNCGVDDPYIRLADATTGAVDVEPYSDVIVNVGGFVRELPKSLLQTCPKSHMSPLDVLLGDYIHGNDTTIFVRGSNSPNPDTPEWITNIISSVTIPVPFPSHSFDNLIKKFSLTDTEFSLPDPLADPGDDDANPQISGTIVVIAGLPKEMNFGINVTQVRAMADVFYKDEKLGVLNLRKWQHASSERVEPEDGEAPALKIQSRIKNAPLEITDEDVFASVVQAMFFGEGVKLKIKALVDAEISTVLGDLVVKSLPAEGIVPVKPISTGHRFGKLQPKVGDLRILGTSKTSLKLEARVNFTNPTKYTAKIPYINIHILNNGSIIGDATAREVNVKRGNNSNILIQATWDPTKYGGEKAGKIGRELLSQYISGYNTTLTFQTHKHSIPHQPKIGKALSKFAIEIPTPRISAPSTGHDGKDGDDKKPHFIDNAVFHLLSSTSTFTLLSPLQHSTLFIESINATAFYNHTDPVGEIIYDLPFKVPPGASQTPRLPVDWSLDSIGYEEMQKALGGTLKLDAKGTVGIRLGEWTETVWYVGSGIGASVRF